MDIPYFSCPSAFRLYVDYYLFFSDFQSISQCGHYQNSASEPLVYLFKTWVLVPYPLPTELDPLEEGPRNLPFEQVPLSSPVGSNACGS